MRHSLKMVLGAVALCGALIVPMLTAGPARADETVEDCFTGAGGNGTLCYYFDTNYNGAEEGIANADPDETVDPYVVFQYRNVNGGTDGLNDCVPYPTGNLPCALNNEAEAGANFRTDCRAHMFYYVNYGTPELTFAPYPQSGYANPTLGGTGVLQDENRSQNFC